MFLWRNLQPALLAAVFRWLVGGDRPVSQAANAASASGAGQPAAAGSVDTGAETPPIPPRVERPVG